MLERKGREDEGRGMREKMSAAGGEERGEK
jgi:hypothetical protein